MNTKRALQMVALLHHKTKTETGSPVFGSNPCFSCCSIVRNDCRNPVKTLLRKIRAKML